MILLKNDPQNNLATLTADLGLLSRLRENCATGFDIAINARNVLSTTFVNACNLVSTELFDNKLKDELLSFPSNYDLVLRLPECLHRLPWERFEVAGQMLCQRFSMTRQITELQNNKTEIEHHQKTANVLISEGSELLNKHTELISVKRRLRTLTLLNQSPITNVDSVLGELSKSKMLDTLSTCSWVHFAGHADDVRGVRQLRLANGELLTPEDIVELESTPAIVVLNACSALRFPRAIGSGNENQISAGDSLVSAFLSKGTQYLLGATAPVADDECLNLIIPFYNALASGQSVSDSLSFARKSALDAFGVSNAIAWTYVLYGLPNSSLSGKDIALTNNREKPSVIGFPKSCAQCDYTVETRHGIGEIRDGQIICRKCVKLEQSNARPTDVHLGGKSVWNKQAAKMAIHSSPDQMDGDIGESLNTITNQSSKPQFSRDLIKRALEFRKRTWEDLVQFNAIHDFRTGKVLSCTIRPSFNTQVSQFDRPLLNNPVANDPSAVAWVDHYEIAAKQPAENSGSEIISKLTIAHAVPQFEIAPLSVADIDQCLNGLPCELDSHHQCIIIGSLAGFEDANGALQKINEQKNWLEKNTSVILFDHGNFELTWLPVDKHAYALKDLFKKHSLDDQFEIVLGYVEQQLPLVSSVSSVQIAKEMSFDESTARAALRIAAVKFKLCSYETEEYGVVISEE